MSDDGDRGVAVLVATLVAAAYGMGSGLVAVRRYRRRGVRLPGVFAASTSHPTIAGLFRNGSVVRR